VAVIWQYARCNQKLIRQVMHTHLGANVDIINIFRYRPSLYAIVPILKKAALTQPVWNWKMQRTFLLLILFIYPLGWALFPSKKLSHSMSKKTS
ncbi:MAG: hypothetical protein KDE66_06530, partial [Nitrosomonas sp.]|nr:hypothetical protein [Nitrosomonas sp.]